MEEVCRREEEGRKKRGGRRGEEEEGRKKRGGRCACTSLNPFQSWSHSFGKKKKNGEFCM